MITTCSRRQFKLLKPSSNCAVISISSPDHDYNDNLSDLMMSWRDVAPVLELQFHDSEKLSPKLVRFNRQHLEALWQFMAENKNRPIIIHCDAGLSRSVAVGQFFAEYLNLPLKTVGTDGTLRNSFIFTALQRYERYIRMRIL